MRLPLTLAALALACSGGPAPVTAPAPTAAPAAPAPTAAAAPATPAAPALTAIAIPPDGKYENLRVAGVTVPMINIMDGGATVLVDTDGVKPRSWEEQYKRHGDLPTGYFDLHKTNVNKDDGFDDDAIDREGRWKMDGQGNITQD